MRVSLSSIDTDETELSELSVRAVTTAAHDLELDPIAFAEELAQGEIGLLVRYLRTAASSVDDMELRTRIDALLHRLTAWPAERARSRL